MAFDTNSNKYTFIFSIALVVVVASLLAFAAEGLKPLQKKNISREKMQNILSSVGIEVSADEAEATFAKYITEQHIIGGDGKIKETSLKAFDIDVLKEYKSGLSNVYSKFVNDQEAIGRELMAFNNGEGANLPLYICTTDKGEKNYIVPLVGKGLWGPIWGYIAFKENMNTVAGVTFDHKTETPGLGAEINQPHFENAFIGKSIFDDNMEFVSIKVIKGGAKEGDDHGVDAISGGTITSNGVTEMIERTLKIYEPYFKSGSN